MNFRFAHVGALILLSSVASAGEEKISLRWNVHPNQRYESQIQMIIDAGEQGTVHGILHFAERILSVTPKQVVASVYVPGVTITATGSLAIVAESLRDIKGAKFQRTTDLQGKSLAVDGMQALASGALDLTLPEKEVGIGDTWSAKFTPNELVGEVEMKYKLISFNERDAIIQGDLQPTETVKVGPKPYRFVVDRETGRYRDAEGYLSATLQGINLNLTFTHRTIFPNKLRPYGPQ